MRIIEPHCDPANSPRQGLPGSKALFCPLVLVLGRVRGCWFWLWGRPNPHGRRMFGLPKPSSFTIGRVSAWLEERATRKTEHRHRGRCQELGTARDRMGRATGESSARGPACAVASLSSVGRRPHFFLGLLSRLNSCARGLGPRRRSPCCRWFCGKALRRRGARILIYSGPCLASSPRASLGGHASGFCRAIPMWPRSTTTRVCGALFLSFSRPSAQQEPLGLSPRCAHNMFVSCSRIFYFCSAVWRPLPG